ncbi:MAG: 16S rRNA (cytosine(1402)-N(4))-methyltransferase, partial [Candidatus Daviesbacteria bacterium]|nr:16S rRNA (cytosine(1402)-N(4))-methyltransferase [Candidatus Daviesbacteria bacterium]
MSKYHIPVMLNEAISYLNVQPGHWYIDCNLGGGGHTDEILKKGGKVLGIDLDPDAIKEVAKNHPHLFAQSENLILCQDNFSHISRISLISHISPISGILFDLGASSSQFDNKERGFSFN